MIDLTLGEKLALGFGRSMLYYFRLYPVFPSESTTAQRFYCDKASVSHNDQRSF